MYSNKVQQSIQINDSSRYRYHALSISSVWDLDVLRRACALVVGAGALGNEVAKNLTMMGIGLVVVVDRDTVEVANLSRSVFFRESDHGSSKTKVLVERLEELNPDVDILPLTGDIDRVVGLGLIRRMDMIFSCLDNRLARRTLNRMCQKMAKPWVDGAMENLIGDITAYLPDEGPCYECCLTPIEEELIAKAVSCQRIALKNLTLGKVPTTSTMGSIIAAIQVQEAIKILHGDLKSCLRGKRLVLNCAINDFYTVRTDRKENCNGHYRYGEVTEVPQWKAADTSPREILKHFKAKTGQEAHLRLGREIITGIRCWKCSTEELLQEPLHLLTMAKATCPQCGDLRNPQTTHVIRGTELYAEWPLSQLGVPPLDILEVRSHDKIMWFELTGDASMLPSKAGNFHTDLASSTMAQPDAGSEDVWEAK